MKLLEKILIPTDFGLKVNSILPLVGKLARAFDSTAIPLHVACRLPDCPKATSSGEDEVNTKMDSFVHDLLQVGVPQVQPIIVEGNPPLQIELAATHYDADLVMLALDSKPVEGNPWFGTITQKLLRRINSPLWISRTGAVHSLRNILCAVDFSESTRCALQAAVTLARCFEGKLSILHVVPNTPQVVVESSSWFSEDRWIQSAREDSAASVSPAVAAGETSAHLAAAKHELDRFIAQFDLGGIWHEGLVRSGFAVDQILAVAAEHAHDLIVLGSHESTEVGRLNIAVDSTSESVVEASNVPVLVFRTRELFVDKQRA